MKSRKRANIFLATSVVISVSLFAAAFECVLYEDVTYVCVNTGSLQGHREWFFGNKTRFWQRTSALEDYVKSEAPERFENNWRFIYSTGINGFGQSVLHSDGKSWPAYRIKDDALREWIEDASHEDIISLYELLKTGDFEEPEARVREMDDQGLLRR